LGDLIVPFEAEVRPAQDRAAFVVEAVAAELAGASGRLRADLRAEGEMPLGVPEPAMATTASGRLQLRADDLSVPEVASGIDGSGDLAFVLERGALDATLADVRLQFDTLAPAWDAVAELLPPPWQLELARSVGISTSLRGDEILLQGSGEFALATAGPQVEAVLSASATLDAERRLRELVVPDTEVVLHQLLRDELRLERATLRGEGAGTPEAWEGSLDLDLAGAGAPWPGLTLEGVTARAALNVQVADGRLR